MKHQATLSTEDMAALTNYLVNATETNRAAATANTDGGSGPELGGYLYTEYLKTDQKTVNFDIRYLALWASGWINEKIAYVGEFELEHGGKGENTFVEQAYIDFWLNQNVAVKVGAMLTPFNRFDEFHDPLTNALITRPQVSRELGVSAWRDVGVDLHGYFNLSKQSSVAFDLYAINGLGSGSTLRKSRQYRDNNEDLGYGARFNFLLYDIVEVGFSGYQGAWDDNGDYKVTLLGGHLMVKTDLVDLYAEYTDGASENPALDTLGSTLADGDMSGYFVQVSRLFEDKYRPTVRVGALDYLDLANGLGRTPTNKDLIEIDFGFTYYPTPKVAIKVEYTIFDETGRMADFDNNQIGFQTAVKF